MTKVELLINAKANCLSAGGVDNWEWYSESLEDHLQGSPDTCSNEEWLNALENGGVDNWSWYGDSLEQFWRYEEHLNELERTGVTDFPTFEEWSNTAATSETIEVEVVPEAISDTPVLPLQRNEMAMAILRMKIDEFLATKPESALTPDEFYTSLVDIGWLKADTYPKVFKKATTMVETPVVESGEGFMSMARLHYINLLIKKNILTELFTKAFENVTRLGR